MARSGDVATNADIDAAASYAAPRWYAWRWGSQERGVGACAAQGGEREVCVLRQYEYRLLPHDLEGRVGIL